MNRTTAAWLVQLLERQSVVRGGREFEPQTGLTLRALQSKQVKRSSHEWINKFIIANLILVIISIICSSDE